MPLNRHIVTLIVQLLLLNVAAAQITACPELGQSVGGAFPVCGSNVFSQSEVKPCGGDSIPIPDSICSIPFLSTPYTDINPYWYKFTCFKTGTFAFAITPNIPTDDYDWQIFDITGHDPKEVYTNLSLFVACNWSGNGGVTGANSSGQQANGCEGYDAPNISAMPTLIAGHDYLMLVSHYTSTDNTNGYTLSFGGSGSTATITDPIAPKISKISINCSGDKIGIKLDKKMLCKSMATDGSDFYISTNPAIAAVTGVGCKNAFDMDSIVIQLAAGLAVGDYQLAPSPTNKIGDLCSATIPLLDTFKFSILPQLPTIMDSITTPLPCAPQQLQLVFKTPIRCSSVAADGSQFAITGPDAVDIASATTVCDTNALSTVISINLKKPIITDGNYKISLKNDVNFSPIINECSVPTPKSSLQFKAVNKVNADFSYKVYPGCKQDTVKVQYVGIATGTNNANSWAWYIGDTLYSTSKDTSFVYTTFTPKAVRLQVSNGICNYTNIDSIFPINHAIKADFSLLDTICSNEQAIFKDQSQGVITAWKWSFGNDSTSTAQMPAAQTYLLTNIIKTYQAQLIVTNQVGCIDTSALKPITVKSATPVLPDSITALACAATAMELVFKAPVKCGSIASDGSNFTITGPSLVNITGATINCDGMGLGSVVEINLSTPIKTNGIYHIAIHKAANGDSIRSECGVATPDTVLAFSTIINVFANADTIVHIGCKQDTLITSHDGKNNVNSWTWVLADTIVKMGQKDTFIYNNFTQKPLKLIVSNGICTDSSILLIKPIDHTIKTGFSLSDTICGNELTTFKDMSQGVIVAWKWNFGNGSTSNAQVPLAQIYPFVTGIKTYLAQLIVTNQVGCIDTSTLKPITVKSGVPSLPDSVTALACAATTIELIFNVPVKCSSIATDGSNFTITGPSIVNILGATVNCNDKGLGSVIKINLSTPIKTNGNYHIAIHKAANGDSIRSECGVATPDTVLAFATLNNVFANSDTIVHIGCKQDTLITSHDRKNNINLWTWVLADTIVKTGQKDTFIYNNFNPKTLKLIVTNGICTDSSLLLIRPLDHTVKAAFSTQAIICPDVMATFTNESLGNLTNWAWSFGDGDSSHVQSPLPKKYPSLDTATTYKTRLVVKNAIGCLDTSAYKAIVVTAFKPALLDTIPVLPCEPTSVQVIFKGLLQCSSLAADGSNFSITGPSVVSIANAIINCNAAGFGDTVQLVLASPIRVAGRYTLAIKKSTANTFLAADCNAATPVGSSISFNALNAANADFTFQVAYGCKADTIAYMHDGKNGVNKWNWDFGNGVTSTKQDTTIIYNTFTPKLTTLIVANDVCSDKKDVTITLKNEHDDIKAGFVVEKQNGTTIEELNYICPTEKAIFKDTSTGIINKWQWEFGDNTTSTAPKPSPKSYARPNNTTDYLVRLIITGNYCTDTAYNHIKVIPNCYIDVPSAFTPNGDQLNDYLFPLNAYKAENLDFKVFNRFGQLIFETKDWTKPWDGKVNGTPQDAGTYVWMLHYVDHDTKEPVSKQGVTVLIR
ncbi:gliding motility-associated C-terminal domain-containing protein [Parasediminibacterium sp. JCM 36343]|uniref:T9SS type B sorting domain-containing protein n=1 Tax=Parasediminibacterium sp. JCM 36343 TaxID=3374279 RepID=UPI00397CFC70